MRRCTPFQSSSSAAPCCAFAESRIFLVYFVEVCRHIRVSKRQEQVASLCTRECGDCSRSIGPDKIRISRTNSCNAPIPGVQRMPEPYPGLATAQYAYDGAGLWFDGVSQVHHCFGVKACHDMYTSTLNDTRKTIATKPIKTQRANERCKSEGGKFTRGKV